MFGWIVRHHHEGVRYVSLVLLEILASTGDDSGRVLALMTTDRQQQGGELVIEQIGGESAVVGEVLPESEEVVGIPVDLRCQIMFMSEPSIPPDVAIGVPVVRWSGIRMNRPVELTSSGVSAIGALTPDWLAD